MIIQDFFPSEAVRAIVQCYRIVHFEFDKKHQVPPKAYPPKPENCLHFFLYDSLVVENTQKTETQPSILFRGQQTSVVHQRAGSHFVDVQIVFQPAAIFRITGVPAQELVDLRLDATSLFPKNVVFILEQLRHAGDYHKMIHILEHYAKGLLSQVRNDDHSVDRVSQEMLHKHGVVTVDMLAKDAFYSTKQMKRKFLERVGLNPKLYSRIVRFNKAYNVKNRFPGKHWSAIASHCGYTDYQHLSKDYKEFTRLTPPEFHVLESKAPENVLGIAKPLYTSRYRTS